MGPIESSTRAKRGTAPAVPSPENSLSFLQRRQLTLVSLGAQRGGSPLRRPTGYSSDQGFTKTTPHPSKSPVFRVAMDALC